ncbi:MAG: hypothetical protein M1167_02475 [Chloroflexi bacterium]|nr:hypothetical protein [Chloroflexota bacterium]
MRKTLIAILAAVLIIVIIGGYLDWTIQNQKSSNPSPSGSDALMQQIRDQAMVYIEANNTQTVQLMQDLAWSGGRQDTGVVGSETYLYCSGNWAVQIQYPVVQNPVYTITANYTSGDVTVNWVGTCQNSLIEMINQTINVPLDQTLSTQEQVRDITMAYIKAYHTQTGQYMQGFMWSGGRMTAMGMMGSETYSYQSSGWNMTMQYPVVPNPIYTITAQYTSTGMHSGNALVTWQGTMQNGTVTETDYKYNP